MQVIYLSGPITKGDREENFQQAATMQRALMARGFAVINPMLTMKLPYAWDLPHDAWMQNDLPIIERVDAVLRLPGESIGADIETTHATKHNIPVFTNVTDLLTWRDAQ